MSFVTFIPIGAINERRLLESFFGEDADNNQTAKKLINGSKRRIIRLKAWPPDAVAALQENS